MSPLHKKFQVSDNAISIYKQRILRPKFAENSVALNFSLEPRDMLLTHQGGAEAISRSHIIQSLTL